MICVRLCRLLDSGRILLSDRLKHSLVLIDHSVDEVAIAGVRFVEQVFGVKRETPRRSSSSRPYVGISSSLPQVG